MSSQDLSPGVGQLVRRTQISDYRPWMTRRWLEHLTHTGEIPCYRLGGRLVVVDLDDVDRWAAANAVQITSDQGGSGDRAA